MAKVIQIIEDNGITGVAQLKFQKHQQQSNRHKNNSKKSNLPKHAKYVANAQKRNNKK